jgi:hypothetical protein
VSQHIEALSRASASGADLAFVASQAAATADWGSLTAANGKVDLERVRAMREPVAASSAAIDAALVTLGDIRSPWLVPPVGRRLESLAKKLETTHNEASTAIAGLDVVPALLGGDGPRRYFLAFGTPGETRNAGGYVGAFGVLTADQGTLHLERTGPTQDLNPRRGTTYRLDYPPDWELRYGTYNLDLYPGNMSASPDWPTDAEIARQIYPQTEGGAPIDGVLYADPAALAALLELTGPVSVEGIPAPLTAENVEHYLLVDQYVQYSGSNATRKDVLGDVAKSVFDALTSRPLPGIRSMTDVLGPAVAEGHLKVVTFGSDPERSFLDRVGISGRWDPSPGADYLSMRSANLQPTKIDTFVHRDIAVTTDLDPRTNQVTTTVEMTVRNDAPASGLPPYVIGSGSAIPSGTSRDILTLYSPLQLTEATLDGQAAAVGRQTEFGGNTYAIAVQVGPGESTRLTYRLTGPLSALAADGTYRVDLLPQAFSAPDQWATTITVDGKEVDARSGPLDAKWQLEAPLAATGG